MVMAGLLLTLVLTSLCVRGEYYWTGTEWEWREPGHDDEVPEDQETSFHISPDALSQASNYDDYYESDENYDYNDDYYSHLVKALESTSSSPYLGDMDHPKVNSCCLKGSKLTLKSLKEGGYKAECVDESRQVSPPHTVPSLDNVRNNEEVLSIAHLEFVGTKMPQCSRGMIMEEVMIWTTELTTTTTTTTTTTPPQGWLQGWCLDQHGDDQNTGVIHLGWKSSAAACLELCRDYQEATGCEFFRGSYTDCVVHTRDVITANGDDEHQCFVFSETESDSEAQSVPDHTEPSYNAALSPQGQLLVKQQCHKEGSCLKYDLPEYETYDLQHFCVETTWEVKNMPPADPKSALTLTCDFCKEKVFCHYLKSFFLPFLPGHPDQDSVSTDPKHVLSVALFGKLKNFEEVKTKSETLLKDVWELFDSNKDGQITEVLDQQREEVSIVTLIKIVEFLFNKFDTDWDDKITVYDWNVLTGRSDRNVGRKLISFPLPVYKLYTRIDLDKDEGLTLLEIKDFVKRTFALLDKNEDCLIDLKEVVHVLQENELPKDLQLAVKLLAQTEITVVKTFIRRLFAVADMNKDNVTEVEEILNFSDFDFIETEGKEMLMLAIPNTDLLHYLQNKSPHSEEKHSDVWLVTLQNLMKNQLYDEDPGNIKCA